MEGKKVFLIGPIGYGKSTTGCTLLESRNAFTKGADMNRVTTSYSSKLGSNGMRVIDSPGVGDLTDDIVFQTRFLENKDYLLSILPIDAFVLVIKFDGDQSKGFYLAAQQYFRYFGRMAIKSLMIFCIQGNERRIYSDDDFRRIFLETDGYKYLLTKNNGKSIPYCLWDNFSPSYFEDQKNQFLRGLTSLKIIGRTGFEYICDMLENDIYRINESKKKDEKIQILNNKFCHKIYDRCFGKTIKIFVTWF